MKNRLFLPAAMGVLSWAVIVGTAESAEDEKGSKSPDRPHAVFVVGTHHDSPQKTLPAFAKKLEEHGFRTTVLLPKGNPERNQNAAGLPGLDVLETADVAVFYLRFLRLPEKQLGHILDYVKSGRPVIGLRTTTHAFDYPQGHRFEKWNDGFGRDVLGSTYFIHLDGRTTVEHIPQQKGNILLNGVPAKFLDPGSLYKVKLPDDATPLLMGTGHSRRTGKVQNDFGTHHLKKEMSWPVAWTWQNGWGGRVFATTLGHRESFELPALNRLLINAVHWAVDRPVDISRSRGTVAKRNKRLQRPVGELDEHDPQREKQSFRLLEGFEVNLWAAEPMLVNPIHMTWDPQGRLWVCCSRSYPHVKPGEEPNDTIVVLEDTDGDGRADKSTTFADGLYVPTGLELGNGGVYVANAPDLVFLKDTDGDLKADVRRTVLTGFATEDIHHCISAWRWGPGGWLYFQEGTFMHSQVETPHGVVRLENGGVFQFRPEEMRLRVYADYRASNPWGHTFNRWGEGVLIDNPRLYFLAPLTANSRAKLSYDASCRGSTKQCGGEFVSGRHLPKKYRGEIWTNQYKGHQVARYEPMEDGSGLSFRELEPVLRSDSGNFRPVDLKIGPDGAAYVLDWYNPLIGHMQHSFRDARRDTTHGRVWRIRHKDRPLVEKPPLPDRPLKEVVEHLQDPEGWTRYQVRRILADAEKQKAAAALDAFVNNLDPQAAEFEHYRLEALWGYQTVGVVNEPLLRAVLESPEPRARTAALRVLRYWHDEVANPLQVLRRAVQDEHPRVRLEAVLTLGFVPNPQSVVIATRVLNKPTDRYLQHALKLTVDGLQPHWLPAYRQGALSFGKPEHRTYALSHLLTNEAVEVSVDLLNSGRVQPEQLQGPARAIARQATGRQLEKLILTLTEHVREYGTRGRQATDPQALTVVLEALNRAARQRNVKPPHGARLVRRCFTVPHPSTRIASARLVGAWKLSGEGKRLQQFVRSAKADWQLRQAAAESLGELGERKFLKRLAESSESIAQRYLAGIGLATADPEQAAPLAAKLLAADPQDADPVPLVDVFLERQHGADQLAAALKETPPHGQVAERIMAHFNRIGEQHPGLIEAFGGKVEAGSLEDRLLQEDRGELAIEAYREGNPHRGERIFRRKKLACMNCHAIGGAGPIVGPDLGTVGSGSPPEYIIDALLRPSKVIKEFFETVNVLTTQGRVMTGTLVTRDDEKVVIRDPEQAGREVTIPADQIAGVQKGKSLMPTGLANKLNSRQEFLDLARFLMELGRPGPFSTKSGRVIRRWRIRHTDAQIDNVEPDRLEALAEEGKPAYSMVSGLLPASSFPDGEGTVMAAGQIDVSRAGKVRLKLNMRQGLRLFIDGEAVSLKDDAVIRLTTGRNTLLFAIDPEVRGENGLRAELLDMPKSPARYKIVGGR